LPTAFVAAFPHDHSQNMFDRRLATPEGARQYLDLLFWISFATLTGLPATTAPVGLTRDGLPVGIQIVGPYLEDATPIDVAGRLAAVADTINAIDPLLSVEPRNTRGSTENVPLLEAGQLDLALVQGEVVHEALTGVGRPPAKLAILFAMYSTPGMFVVRADSPYRAIADLRGKPVAFGARGSGLVILARYVLDGLGLAQERDFHAVYLDRAGDGPAMVLDGRVAALWGGGLGWPGFSAVA